MQIKWMTNKRKNKEQTPINLSNPGNKLRKFKCSSKPHLGEILVFGLPVTGPWICYTFSHTEGYRSPQN